MADVPVMAKNPNESLLDVVNHHFGIQSLASDVATLSHCNLSKILQSPEYYFQHESFQKRVLDHVISSGAMESAATIKGVSIPDITDEVKLQILELFARAAGACDFARYQHPSKALVQQVMASIHMPSPAASTEHAILVFVIAAFEDFPQLKELIQAIHLPQHLILIHLERQTDPGYLAKVHDLPQTYSNVHILQVGTIVYPSDSLSQINHAIMQSIASMDHYNYDYLITLSATSYPLYNAHELARYLKKAPKRIRLGILHGGDPRLCRRRAASLGLFYTRQPNQKRRIADIYDVLELLGSNSTNKTLPVSAFGPKGLRRTCRLKTTSGNTAAFDRDSIQHLANSTMVKDYFARFKQAGQCCVEESSWGAALHVIGNQEQIPMVGAMWQAWSCGMGMRNVYLTNTNTNHHHHHQQHHQHHDGEFCLAMHDKSVYPDGIIELRTTEAVEKALILGKQQGNLFARKFHSRDRYWMEWIQAKLHNQYTPST